MTEEPSVGITFDEFSDPTIAYAVENDDPRITRMNEAFERLFDSISSGTPIITIFERFSVVNSTGNDDPITHLVHDDCVGFYLDGLDEGGPFFARALPTGDGTGILVFTDLREQMGVAETTDIDQVSSVISHDLRNPLDVAKANLRAARETGDPEHFDAVSNAHDRMEQIIRDVLTLTRDHTAVDPSEHISIEAAAKDAWQSVDTEHAALDLTDALPTVTADSDRVQRLFENLFRNSVEHGSGVDDQSMKHGQEAESERGVTVTVGALENGFYVADDGLGIPPEEQDVVFDPGYSTQDGGTGLGLAIVERIVAAHDWDLTLTTATNGGARFEIRF